MDDAKYPLVVRLTSGTLGRAGSALGALPGFLLAGYTGALLATTQFPAWLDTPMLGTLFVASGMSTGLAAIALIIVMRGHALPAGSWSSLKMADNVAIMVEILVLVTMLAWLGTSAAPFLKPLNAVLLLAGALGLGLVMPLLLQWRAAFAGAHSSTPVTMTSALLVLMGGLLLRSIIVLAPQGLM